jgi:hypothetical protein
MTSVLRATRYLKDCRDAEAFSALVADVQKFSFKDACAFYDEFVPGLNAAEQAFLGANDRFFLLTEVLGRKNIVPSMRHPWLYERVREVEAKPDGFVDLWSREHGKSSVITTAGSIQEVVADPEVTIGIFSVVKAVAARFVRQIMDEFETNVWLRRLYPDVIWERPKVQAPLWSKDEGLIIRRVGNPKEPTVSGWGLIDGMPVGMHFKLRIYDDVITEKYQNPEQCAKAVERWEMSDNLGSGEGRFWAIGTRYFQEDPYEIMMERGVVKPRIYPATDNGRADGKPVFWDQETWERKKRIQRSTMAAQLLQNPLADGQAIFDPLTLRSFSLRPRTINVYILGDYAGSKSKTSDRTAFAVIGVDAAENKYLIDGFCHRMSLTEKWQCLSHLWTKWNGAAGVQHVQVAYERYGANSDIEYFEREMTEKDAPKFGIEVVNYAQELNDQSKKARVARLEPDFTANAFYLPAKVWRPNAAWWVTSDKWKDPKTGKSFGPGVEIAGPMPDDAKGEQHVGPRVCLWSVNPEDGRILYRPIPMDGTRVRPTTSDSDALRSKEPYRLVNPIKRYDSEDNAYDLTHVFIEEFKAFPKSTLRDLVDATSRIYDVNSGLGPSPPMIVDEELLRTPEYED